MLIPHHQREFEVTSLSVRWAQSSGNSSPHPLHYAIPLSQVYSTQYRVFPPFRSNIGAKLSFLPGQ
jgi:hypothetical protein